MFEVTKQYFVQPLKWSRDTENKKQKWIIQVRKQVVLFGCIPLRTVYRPHQESDTIPFFRNTNEAITYGYQIFGKDADITSTDAKAWHERSSYYLGKLLVPFVYDIEGKGEYTTVVKFGQQNNLDTV